MNASDTAVSTEPTLDGIIVKPKRRWPLYLCASASIIANLATFLGMRHVFNTAAYSRAAVLLPFLRWAFGLCLGSAALIALFRSFAGWKRKFIWIFMLDALASLLVFVLFRALRIPDDALRKDVFGFAYTSLIFCKCILLVWYAISNASQPRAQMRVWVFTATLLIYGMITPWVAFGAWPDADEPHYLLLTHSLLRDKDFDMANNYRQGDYKSFYPLPLEHHTQFNRRGEEVPIHDIGISVLLLPGYALGGRVGAMLQQNIIAAILALGLFEFALILSASGIAAVRCWSIFAFTSPIIVYSSQIYPEIAGACGAVWATILFSRFFRSGKVSNLLSGSVLLSALPWLSVRYWVIAGLSSLIVFCYVVLYSSRRDLIKRLAALISPYLVSLLIFAILDFRLYGTRLPNAGYVLFVPTMIEPMFIPKLHVGLSGLLFDRGFGLFPTAPVYLLAFAPILFSARKQLWLTLCIVIPAVAYIVFGGFNRFWYGGWAPPPRYIVLAVALLAPLSSLVLRRIAAPILLCVLLIWSAFISIGYTAIPVTRYTYWSVNEGALSAFIHRRLGFGFGPVFPSFIRAATHDYLLFGFWLLVALVCMWRLTRNGSGEDNAATAGLAQY